MSNTSLLGSYGGQDNSALMFRNRLINAGSFDIWQRGTSFSSLASGVYTADRWLTDGAVTTVARSGSQNNVMQVITQAGTGIAQRIETNAGGFFAGQTYTVSGLVNCSVADLTVIVTYRAGNTFKSTIHNANVSSQLTANTYSRFTTTFTLANAPTDFAGTDCIQVSFTSSVVNTINFQSAQFEAGPTATPFERRPIGVELQLAQRYTLVYPTHVSSGYSFGMMHKETANLGDITLITPVPLRALPSWSTSGTVISRFIGNTEIINFGSTPATALLSGNLVFFSVTVTGITNNVGVANVYGGGNIIISAEL